ncbi:MAG TPA: hypothetical protein VGM01_04400, partial [Ktedonobacteraceae bacterium]
QVRIIDPPFQEKFFEHLQTWKGVKGWEDRVEQIEEGKVQREQTILGLIAQTQAQWQEAMDTLKDPTIPKTKQMRIDLSTTCQGLEEKIARLQVDLDQPPNKAEDDEVIRYQIYTLLPDLFEH